MATTTHPIPLDRYTLAIADLDLPLIHNEITRLENSIFHLRRSNAQLEVEIESLSISFTGDAVADNDTKETWSVLGEAVKENLEVIGRQEERITACKEELERRGVGRKICGETEAETNGAATNGNGVGHEETNTVGVNGESVEQERQTASVAREADGNNTDAERPEPSSTEEGVYL